MQHLQTSQPGSVFSGNSLSHLSRVDTKRLSHSGQYRDMFFRTISKPHLLCGERQQHTGTGLAGHACHVEDSPPGMGTSSNA